MIFQALTFQYARKPLALAFVSSIEKKKKLCINQCTRVLYQHLYGYTEKFVVLVDSWNAFKTNKN